MKLYDFCKQIVDINGKPLAAMVRKTEKDGRQRETIIAASVFAAQPGTVPYRVVLRFECHKDAGGVIGNFIVHDQQVQSRFHNPQGELDLTGLSTISGTRCGVSSNWHNGNYFSARDYIGALIRYCERCRREIEHHKSLHRAAEEPEA
jgi:hypothetical protein